VTVLGEGSDDLSQGEEGLVDLDGFLQDCLVVLRTLGVGLAF
jgi:hypothetical protein